MRKPPDRAPQINIKPVNKKATLYCRVNGFHLLTRENKEIREVIFPGGKFVPLEQVVHEFEHVSLVKIFT